MLGKVLFELPLVFAFCVCAMRDWAGLSPKADDSEELKRRETVISLFGDTHTKNTN